MIPLSVPPMRLHPDLLALLACCRSAPADDTPRLVLADWLEDNADTAGLPSADDARNRAALIRVQVELARPSYDAAHVAQLHATEQRLLASNAAEWLDALPLRLHQLRKQPFGFAMNLATATPPAFVFDPLSAHNPWRFNRGLLTVNLNENELSDTELGEWFASPLAAWVGEAGVDLGGLSALERLEITTSLRPYLGVRYAIGVTAFPTLQQVRPEQESLSERRCKRLLKSANFGLVRALTVYAPAVEVGFLRMMANADVSGLRSLSVKAAISDTNAAFLAAAPLANLSTLDVSGCSLSADGLRLIANSPHLRQLVSLRAFRNQFGCEGIVALSASPLANSLNALDLQNTGVGDRGVAALGQSPILGRLHGPGLNLSMNPITDTGATTLAACEPLDRFSELILRDCRVSDAGAKALAESPRVANLAYLDLWQNRIGDLGAAALGASPHLDDACVLSLRDNLITSEGERVLRTRFADRVKL